MELNPKLLELIACPNCHNPFVVKERENGLLCTHCQLLFPVRNGIPILLPEEALPWEQKNLKGDEKIDRA